MTRPFLEERIEQLPGLGTSFDEEHVVDNVTTAGGWSYGHALHPYPVLRYRLSFDSGTHDFGQKTVNDLYKRLTGGLGGFRLKHHLDYSTNDYNDVPTAYDQECVYDDSAAGWQITRWYGTQGDLSQSRRRVLKPVDGTALVGIESKPSTSYSVDYTTGIVTFSGTTDAIVGITQASQAVVDFGAAHSYTAGDSLHITGVVGMTEINDRRGEILSVTANTVTLDINSSGYSAYTSGGTANNAPQTGETVTAGCYFDIPVRFDRRLSMDIENRQILSFEVEVVELLNL